MSKFVAEAAVEKPKIVAAIMTMECRALPFPA